MYRQKREQTYFTITGLLSYDSTLFDGLVIPASLNKDTLITEILMTCGLLECAYPDGDIMKQIIGVWSYARKPDWERMVTALTQEYNPLHNYDRTLDLTVDGSGSASGKVGVIGSNTEKETIDDNLTHTDNLTETRDLTNTRTDNLTNTRTDNLQEAHGGGETTEHQNTAYNAGLSTTAKDIMTRDGDVKNNTGTQTNTNTGTQTNKETGTIKHTGDYKENRDIERNLTGNNKSDTISSSENETKTVTHEYNRGNIGVMSTQELLKQEIDVRYKYNIYEIIAQEFKEKFCILIYIL